MDYLGTRSRAFLIAMAVLLVLLVGIADWVTGEELSFSLFYLLPIAFAAWFVGLWAGIAISILSAVAWFAADFLWGHVYSHPLIPYWNTVMRLVIFLIVVFALCRLKVSMLHEHTLSRTDALTGAANRRSFYASAQTEIERVRRYQRPLTVAYLDLDNLGNQ